MAKDDEAPDCPMCASTPELLGRLGFMAHYRCRACGWTFMDPPDSPTRVSEAEHRELAEIRAHHNEEYDAGLDDVDGRYSGPSAGYDEVTP